MDGAGCVLENHPVQFQRAVLGYCSRPGNSGDEEDAVKWLKAMRPAHVFESFDVCHM